MMETAAQPKAMPENWRGVSNDASPRQNIGEVKVTLVKGRGIGPIHAQRYVDRAIYQTLVDSAHKDGTELRITPVRIFQPDEERPAVDDFIMDEVIVERVLDKLMQRDPV